MKRVDVSIMLTVLGSVMLGCALVFFLFVRPIMNYNPLADVNPSVSKITNEVNLENYTHSKTCEKMQEPIDNEQIKCYNECIR